MKQPYSYAWNNESRNCFVCFLETDKSIGDLGFARQFLTAWLENAVCLRPERFGGGEPVRRSIADSGLEKVLSVWEAPGVMFKRVSTPKFVVDVNWRHLKGMDPRPYPWGVNAEVNLNADNNYVLQLFNFLLEWFEPSFALLTTSDDWYAKHRVAYPTVRNGKRIGTTEKNVGANVLEKIPGIYWYTYLTRELICDTRLSRLGDKVIQCDARGNPLIRAYPNSTAIGSKEAFQKEEEIKTIIGAERFFDRAAWKPDEN